MNSVNTYFSAESSTWNDIYHKKDVYSVIHQDRRTIALAYFRELSLPQDAHILEIGCGAGMTSVDIARCGYSIEAVDSVAAMVDLTRANAAQCGVDKQIHVSKMEVFNLQFPDQAFDVVIALGVIPWLTDVEKALKEISRVLAPGGYILINADNRWRLNHLLEPADFPPFTWLIRQIKLLLEKSGMKKISNVPRTTRHSAKEFDHLLKSVGLVKQRQRMIGFGPFTLFRIPLFPGAVGVRLHHFLQDAADRGTPILRSTGSQYLVLGKKI